MQNIIVWGFFIFLIWVVMSFGIEPALAVASLITGIAWLIYKLMNRDMSKPEPEMVEYARSFFPIFLAVLLLRGFLVEPFRIPSGSMMPTLLVGDFILVNKFTYGIRLPVTKTKIIDINEPERGDVVVFRWPVNPKLDYIKRVVGVPGDTIKYRHKVLYVNGKAVEATPVGPYEPIGSGMRAAGSFEATEHLPDVDHNILVNPLVPDFSPSCGFLRWDEVTVPEGHYFMMGDNRDDSNDSRCWGFVPDENLVGNAFMIWLSWDWQRPGFVGWERIGDFFD